MALCKQGKMKKHNVMVFFFHLPKGNGTYHDWLVIITGGPSVILQVALCVI